MEIYHPVRGPTTPFPRPDAGNPRRHGPRGGPAVAAASLRGYTPCGLTSHPNGDRSALRSRWRSRMAVSPRLVVADPDGQILDHPFLRMAGHSGPDVVAVPSEDLLRLARGLQAVQHAREPAGGLGSSAADLSLGPARSDRRAAFHLPNRGSIPSSGLHQDAPARGRLSHPPAPASALVLHGRRLGWRGLRGGRPPDRSHGPFRRRALRRPRTAAPHEGAAQGARGQSDPRAARPLRHRIPLPGGQESFSGPLGGAAPRRQ